MRKINILILTLIIAFMAGATMAQEEATTTVSQDLSLDESVEAEDLDIEEPSLFPDSPFYFFKEWGRGIQSFFTFNPIAKAKLRERFANEKLLEAKKLIEQNKSREQVERAVRLYQEEIGEVERVTQKIKEKAEENEEVGKFLDKFIQHQVLHQRVLQKLEGQVPTEVFEKIKEAREEHLEKFGQVMTRLENKEKLQERLDENLERLKGSEFKQFKNLEVLENLEEKVPEEAKEAIQKVQANSLIRLREKLKELAPEAQERFEEYVERLSGEKEKHMEILENLKEELRELPAIREGLIQSRENILEQVRERVQERLEETECPVIEKPATGFCRDGRIVVERNEEGCILNFKCVVPTAVEVPKETIPQLLPPREEEEEEGREQERACITLWNPVCGNDGKTYSNECFAKIAGIEVDYKGVCKSPEELQRLKQKLPQSITP